MTSIKQEILDEMKVNVPLKADLASLWGKTTTTVDNHIISNSPLLTTHDALKIICGRLHKSEKEILTES